MSNPIKYSTSGQTEALKVGNWWFGTGDVAKGPTDVTGYWSSISPPSGGYTVNLGSGDFPATFCPANDDELISLTNRIAGTSYTTAAQCLAYYATQADKNCINRIFPPIVTNGLIDYCDGSFVSSYPRTGTVWYDLSSNGYQSSLVNSPTFNSTLNVFEFDNVDDSITVSGPDYNALAVSGNFTIIITGKKTLYGSGGNNVGNSTLFQGVNNGYDNGWRIFENHNGTPGTSFSLPHTIQVGLPDTFSGRAVSDTVYRPFFYAFSFSNGNNGLAFLNENISQGANSYKGTSSPNYGSLGYNGGAGVGRWGGYIADILVYNRALSLSEIRQNYYQAPIVTSGLVFAVDAGNIVSYESGTTTAYSLIGSLSGTLTNGVSYSTGVGGNWGFDGTNDYINFGDTTTTEFGTGNFTLSCWIYIPTDVVENVNFFKGLIIKKGAAAANAGYGIYYNTGQRKFLWSTANGTTAVERYTTNTWESLKGRWSNIVMVRQNGVTNNGFFYINGVYESIASSASIVDVNNDYNLAIGASSTLASNYFFQGNISLGLIYNRALSASEISQNFNAQRTRFGV